MFSTVEQSIKSSIMLVSIVAQIILAIKGLTEVWVCLTFCTILLASIDVCYSYLRVRTAEYNIRRVVAGLEERKKRRRDGA